MQSFRVAFNSMSGATDFLVSYYEEQQVKTATFSIASSNWEYVSGSTKSRGCNVVRTVGTDTYAFLLFDQTQGTLTEFASFTQSAVNLATATIG